jgi:threonine dehydrogenase-like Zn-dependent dehydrogenase
MASRAPERAHTEALARGVAAVVVQGLGLLGLYGLALAKARGARFFIGLDSGAVVNPDAHVTLDANLLVKKWITLRGIHNYHPRHLVQALDFVLSNRRRFPFHEIVDSRFSLQELDLAFKRASERTVLRAAIVP